MKMPRSHCENDNVQFVQELAEVDGPFESPIDINFRDLTKLELPSLIWNRIESCPKKMKITNTGHTVIISGKWKSERPHLTGGPLEGKYVFSQIHFHWGQDDCQGSEHRICGEGFPLEMHVVHFKTEYLTQENALREKDGMVVVVYLFKLQEEPNSGLKRILNILHHVKEANTSHAIDPRPILSLCNPFTDDYFMYWGSVVTSTCAHILLWIVCREPFGICREQVNEFRKILDLSQQPIYRNSREQQPLHKRNVFHVNASKNLNNAMLPIKKIVGCYCKGSEENVSIKPPGNGCSCQPQMRPQEEIEGNSAGPRWEVDPLNDFSVQQSIFVQSATVQSVPLLPNIFGSDYVRNLSFPSIKQITSEGNSNIKPISQSCCFFSMNENNKIKMRSEKTKSQVGKLSFNSLKSLSLLMDSLETLKNHTFKKLKEIESINQEIRGIKSFCQDTEDKRWLRKIEKIMTRQKEFTTKTSHDCFSELKKLAKECNFDKFFDNKTFSFGDNKIWLNNTEIADGTLTCSNEPENPTDTENITLKSFSIRKAATFSEKAQKLIQSFFEDIKENDGIKQSVQEDLNLKKLENLYNRQGGDSPSVGNVAKGYITQKMFNLGNLEDRFFTEVLTDDLEMQEKVWDDKTDINKIVFSPEDNPSKRYAFFQYSDKTIRTSSMEITNKSNTTSNIYNEEIIPLHRVNVAIGFPPKLNKTSLKNVKQNENNLVIDAELEDSHLELSGTGSTTEPGIPCKPYLSTQSSTRNCLKKFLENTPIKKVDEVNCDKLINDFVGGDFLANNEYSTSNLTTYSSETKRMIIGKFHKKKSRKDIWEQRSSAFAPISSKGHKKNKMKNLNFEGYYIKKKNLKNKKKKFHRREKIIGRASSYNFSSTSKEETKTILKKSVWQRLTRAKFKLEIEKTSDSTLESALEYSFISPERKKFKLGCKRIKNLINRKLPQIESKQKFSTDSDAPIIDTPKKSFNNLKNSGAFAWQTANKIENVVGNDTDFLRRKERRIHIPRNNANDSTTPSRVSKTKTFRASSIDSGSSFSKDQKIHSGLISQVKKLSNNCETQTFLVQKNAVKNKSLGNLMSKTRYHPAEIKQRVFVENLDGRRVDAREASQPPKNADIFKEPEQVTVITPRIINASRGTSNETYKVGDREGRIENNCKIDSTERYSKQIQKVHQYKVGFFMTTSNQMDKELLTTAELQEGKDKNLIIKRCDAEKYQFLNKEFQEVSLQEATEEHPELLQPMESNKSLIVNDDHRLVNRGPTMKGDSNVAYPEEKDLTTPVSYSSIRINSQSRPHSAESFNSLTKVCKRKRKKRPNCCKRSSKHYIRKNSSTFRRPNKVESKTQHFLSLTEEEQLKIISVNVANYLKQKLVEQKNEDHSGENCSFKELEQAILRNFKASEEKKNETLGKDKSCEKEIEVHQEEPSVAKETKKEKENGSPEVEITRVEEPKEIKVVPIKKKKPSTSPRPIHDFIKLNKQMAGKYKRLPEKITERKKENQLKKKEETKRECQKTKMKILRKNKDKYPLPKLVEHLRDKSTSQSPPVIHYPLEKLRPDATPKEIRVKNSSNSKILDSGRKNQKGALTKDEKSGQEEKIEEDLKGAQVSSFAVQKVCQLNKRWIPAYMLTSYLPAPIEMVENQQRKMNRCLLNVKKSNVGCYLPEILYETKARKEKNKGEINDPVFAKDLEYLIKLQMCLNNEITANIENSMNYVKTLLNQDYVGSAIIEKAPVNSIFDLYESHNKGVVLIEMNDLLDCSSSSSDLADEPVKYRTEIQSTGGNSIDSKCALKTEEISKTKIPKESGDSQIINPALIKEFDGQEEYNSDSSYNCEISITLNPAVNEGEVERQIYDSSSCMGGFFNNYTYELRRDSKVSQTATQLNGETSSQSIILKPHRKKRKENEISMEMKQKLLEILEGEIQREMAITYAVSSENSSDGLSLKWEESDGMNRSQSTESSCDNAEVLAQISETMRKYLSDFKGRRKLADIIENKIDKVEGKGKDAS